MKLPGEIRGEVEAVLGPVGGESPVGGGCVNPSVRVQTSDGPVFLKYNERAPAGMFEVEAEGLRQLRAGAARLRIPEVLGVGARWLVLEWLEPGERGRAFGETLGRGLAGMHRTGSGRWGWEHEGFIGPLPQPNAFVESWSAFWTHRRLEPQLALAKGSGEAPASDGEWDRLFTAIPAALAAAEEDGPSLLHGDLWGGNVLSTASGEPALVDPAPYYGHREVDLAMSELFGGFGEDFHHAYRECWPLEAGYDEVRRGIYQLYYLLVHVNLFGGGYTSQTERVLMRVLAAI